MDVLEAKVDTQQSQYNELMQQVREMGDRVHMLESRGGNEGGRGVDRRLTLIFGGWPAQTRRGTILGQLEQAIQALGLAAEFDQAPFTTGPRRSVAMANFVSRAHEKDGDVRVRMMKVLQTTNNAKVELQGGVKSLWCSFSRSPLERGRAAVAAVVKKAVMRHASHRAADLDVEYSSGSTWIREDQLSGMGQPPDQIRRAKTLETKAGAAWLDVHTLAKWLETDRSVVEALIEEHRF
ncbi:unnamed protein product [Symbiodinium sp. CCMP2592]|nr:unnamed protein product [Symbiodinium sp. CCMP2592]